MKILGWIVATPFILLAFIILLRVSFCGPNQSDVRIMKSMGDKISRYLVTKGKPTSLDNIPELPHELKCNSSYNCFFGDKTLYKIWIDESSYSFSLKIYALSSKTGITYNYNSNNGKYKLENSRNNPHIFSRKRSGICNPMKQ